MSWDLFAFDIDDPQVAPDGTAEFPDDWEPPTIGSLSEVREMVSSALPEVDWSNLAWGNFENSEASLEFNIGDSEPCTNFVIHARGTATPSVMKLINATGWRILDSATGGWMHLADDPDEGRRQFQAYRDHAVGDVPMRSGFEGLFARLFRR